MNKEQFALFLKKLDPSKLPQKTQPVAKKIETTSVVKKPLTPSAKINVEPTSTISKSVIVSKSVPKLATAKKLSEKVQEKNPSFEEEEVPPVNEEEEVPPLNAEVVQKPVAQPPVPQIPIPQNPDMEENTFLLNNRLGFNTFITQYFKKKYAKEIGTTGSSTCEDMTKTANYGLMLHQKIVSDYLNLKTPYRGLLLYHGLGSGKTCSSIEIIKSIVTAERAASTKEKQILIFTPAALDLPYRGEILKCDASYQKTRNWRFVQKDEKKSSRINDLYDKNVPFAEGGKGAWIIDRKQAPPFNYESLTDTQKSNFNTQIGNMIVSEYEFIHYNAKRSMANQILSKEGKNFFDGKVIVIDEIHNLVGLIRNKLTKKDESDTYFQLYKLLQEAENVKIVLLSGTPVVNFANEIAVIFNILRGAIKMFNFKHSMSSADLELLRQDTLLDDVSYNAEKKIVSITRNPFTFATVEPAPEKKKGLGKRSSDKKFIKYLQEQYKGTSVKVTNYKALTDDVNGFIKEYLDEAGTAFKDPSARRKFQKRILGLTSYFGSQENLMPKLIAVQEANVFMSDTQAKMYEAVRKEELEEAKQNAKKKRKQKQLPETDDASLSSNNKESSTYWVRSRQTCNFVCDALVRPKVNLRQDAEREAADQTILTQLDDELLSDEEPSEVEEEEEPSEVEELSEVEEEPSEVEEEPVTAVLSRKRPASPSSSKTSRKKERKGGAKSSGKTTRKKTLLKTKSVAVITDSDEDEESEENETEEDQESDGDAPTDVLVNDLFGEEISIDDEVDFDNTAVADVETEMPVKTDSYIEEISKYLRDLWKGRATYLMDSGKAHGLAVNSPKFLQILKSVEELSGALHLIYSQFLTLEGMGILKLVLKANGYAELRLKKVGNSYDLNMSEAEIKAPKKFVLYGGSLSSDIKRKLMQIYNGDWANVADTIKKKLGVQAGDTNAEGKFVQIFMITKAGAEGISLRNVQYVHILEPYWNYILLEQVIGRARRICSHQELPPDKRTVSVYIYITKFTKEQLEKVQSSLGDDFSPTLKEIITIDQRIYQIALRKKKMSDTILKAVRETAIDCEIHNAQDTLCLLQNVKSADKTLLVTDDIARATVTYNKKQYFMLDHDKTYLYDQAGTPLMKLQADGKSYANLL
jgi:hypothetical protein